MDRTNQILPLPSSYSSWSGQLNVAPLQPNYYQSWTFWTNWSRDDNGDVIRNRTRSSGETESQMKVINDDTLLILGGDTKLDPANDQPVTGLKAMILNIKQWPPQYLEFDHFRMFKTFYNSQIRGGFCQLNIKDKIFFVGGGSSDTENKRISTVENCGLRRYTKVKFPIYMDGAQYKIRNAACGVVNEIGYICASYYHENTCFSFDGDEEFKLIADTIGKL